jgi:DNA-binding GntR family transcriptional regulator
MTVDLVSTTETRAAGLPLKELAYQRIKDDILHGVLAFGTVISPRKICQQLGMSFLPVADALRLLEAEGLVETKERVGSRVRVPTRADIEGVFTVRAALEAEAARLACERATPSQQKELLRLARQLDRQSVALRKAEPNREANVKHAIRHVEFHLALAETVNCPMLTEAIRRSQVLTFKVQIDSSLKTKQRPDNWHESLVREVFRGDPMAADAAARAHIRYGLDETIQFIETLRVDDRWRTVVARPDSVTKHAK